MVEPLNALIIEDSDADTRLILRELQKGNFDVHYERVDTLLALSTTIHKLPWDVVISDYSLPNFNALEALSFLKQHQIDLPFLIVTGSIGEDMAVEVMKSGAHDCIMKDNIVRIIPTIKRELREARVRKERKLAVESLRIRAIQQAAVAHLGQRALQGVGQDALMTETAGLVAKTLDVGFCEILELQPEENILFLCAGAGWKNGYVGKAKLSAGHESQGGYTLQVGGPVIVEDLRTENRFQGSPLLHAHNIVSGISVIIQGRNRPFGVLGAYTTQKYHFKVDDINFLLAIAHILTTAIDRIHDEEALRNANSELEKSKNALQDLATHDELTGLFNRRELFRLLREEIDRVIRYQNSLSIVMIDIDHFKSINDQYGHQAGDKVLKEFADILKQNTRLIDRVGRYGGEEFVIVLPQISALESFEMAERLRSIVSSYPFAIFKEKQHTLEIHMTISLGIANFPEDAETLDLLVNKTDKALYEAKTRGRNCVVQYRDIQSLKISR